MTEQVDEPWWGILLDKLKYASRSLTVTEIIERYSDSRFRLSVPEVTKALEAFKKRGFVLQYGNSPHYWAFSGSAPVIVVKENPAMQSNGRGMKDTVTRSLLDLIHKSDQQGDTRCVAILEHALSRLYSNDDSL
jgi:hypothetical protein